MLSLGTPQSSSSVSESSFFWLDSSDVAVPSKKAGACWEWYVSNCMSYQMLSFENQFENMHCKLLKW